MELTEFDIELFDSYLREQMTAEEKTAFEERLRTDAACEKKFEHYKLLVEGIRLAGRESFKKFIAKEGEVKYIQNLWGRRWTMLSAAVLLFFAVVFFVIESVQKRLPSDIPENSVAMEEKSTQKPAGGNKKDLAQSEKEKISDSEETLFEEEVFVTDGLAEEDDVELADTEEAMQSDSLTDFALADIEEEVAQTMQGNIPPPPAAALEKSEELEVMSGQLLLDSLFEARLASQDTVGNTDTVYTAVYKSVQLQLWKSPLNSKVYKYTVRQGVPLLEIYGMQLKNIHKVFYFEHGEVVVLGEGVAYRFNPTQAYLPLRADTNKAFIHLLEGLK